MGHTGQDIRKPDHIERVDASGRGEIIGRGSAHRRVVAAQPVVEDAAHQRVERQRAHLRLALQHLAGAAAPAREHGRGRAGHGRGELHEHLASEERSEHAALDRPLLAIGGDQPIAQARRENPPLERALAEIGRVFHQDLADGRWLAHHRNAREREAAHDDGLIEMRSCPALDGVSGERAEQRDGTERLWLRRGSGRAEAGAGGHGRSRGAG